jgi:hypothetical protein
MKAPINFSKRLNAYQLDVDGTQFEITTSILLDNMLWIKSKDRTPNCLGLLFNWEREQYDIVVINNLSGTSDYSRSKQDLGFSPHKFKTFDSFIQFTLGLIRDHKDLFY